MKRKTMHKRITEGHNPLDLSIEKWEGIVEAYKGHESPKKIMKNALDSRNCALCHYYLRSNSSEPCAGCPLEESNNRCVEIDSSYFDYSAHPCLENAKKMLTALRKLRGENVD